MAKLTDTQLIVLSKAATRDDGAASVPDGLNGVAASKLGTSLVSRKLMREVGSKLGMPVWQENEEGGRTSLIITREGRGAIGLDEETNERAQKPTTSNNGDGGVERAGKAQRQHAEKITQPRPGSKQALLVRMVSRKSGATLDALTDATGWLPHTARAALTGLRKRGYALTLERQPGKPSVYRISMAPSRAAA